jgi:hypothetical protein
MDFGHLTLARGNIGGAGETATPGDHVDGPFYVRRKDSPPKLFWLRSAKLIRVGSTVLPTSVIN